MDEQQKQTCSARIEKWFIDLTNTLLRNYKISNIAYLVIKVLEYLQITYFVMRMQSDVYHWNFSIVSYFSIFLNYTVVDSNLKINPSLFGPFLYMMVVTLLLVLALGVVIGVHAGWGKKMPLFVKMLIPALNVMVCLFKSLLAIPAMQLVFICFSPTATTLLNLKVDPGIQQALGTLILFTFLMVKIYILIFFRETNPFSDMQHAGESVLRGMLIFTIKIIFSLYSILDLNNQIQGAANILFTIIISLLIFQSHYEIGLYKHFPKVLEFKLLYFTLTIAILQTLDYYSPNQITSFTYLFPFFLLLHLISDWILDWQNSRAVLLNLVTNNSPEQLEIHVLSIIELVDSINQREKRIQLQGYLNLHCRQCRRGDDCPCHNLTNVRERSEQFIKVDFFKLIVLNLNQSRRKYPHYPNIDLLLGLVYHFRIKNPLQAIYAFTKLVSTHENTLVNRLYVSYYLQRVEEEMIQLDEKEITRTNDINKYLQYTNKMVSFQEHVESCTKHHVEFWRLMLDSNPEIKRLQDLGTLITRNKDYLKQQFQNIFSNNSNSVQLLIIYGKFLLEVTNQESYNVKYLEKADIICKNIKYSSKIDETCSKYNENAQTGVVVITGNQGELGNITHTNNLIRQLLGYKRTELLDRNVDVIMPKIYADNHIATLSRYIGASESKVNGHERVVPALTKSGFILPVTALTKALPTLTKGIQIVGFLAKLQQTFKEEQDAQKHINYMLYRTDTQQILGISEGCYDDYHIDPSLVYGNPYNMNNQLKIKHLFGVSYQRSEEGKIATALQIGEVEMTINTTSLKNEFIISKTTSKDNLGEIDEEGDRDGVEVEIVVRNILCTVYYGITLKMIVIYPKRQATGERNALKRESYSANLKRNSFTAETNRERIEQNTKTDSDDVKNLKDFKNFISLKSQPSAITALSTICIFFVLLICSSTVGLIINWFNNVNLNQSMMNLSEISLFSELATPEMITQTEKQIMGLSSSSWNVTNFTSYSASKLQFLQIVSSLKDWQLKILPDKYSFNPEYSDQTVQYSVLSNGNIAQTSLFIEQVVNNYISQLETISLTSIASLQNFTANRQSNVYQKYASAKINELFSIRSALNSSNSAVWSWYKSSMATTSNIIISVCCVMIGGVVVWLVLLLPYVLSVTKINNRVLSLFSLIPYAQICKLIYGCLLFLNNNLSEANINLDDLKYYQTQQNAPSNRLNQSNINSPSNLNSPSQIVLTDNSYTQSNILRKSEMGRGGMDSVMMIQQKFQKMKNSQDRNKKIVILKFLTISLVFLAFILFNLFYSLSIISQASASLSNYQMLGRRPALIRNAKLLLIEYLINPLYSPMPGKSIKTLNLNIISQFYILESNLLYLNLGTTQSTYNSYNNGDICSQISSYSSFSIFSQQFSSSQCYSVHAQILQKGVKTGIVDVLESIRSFVSQYNSTVPRSILTTNVLIFDILTKYIETPTLAILSTLNSNLNKAIIVSRTVILLSGGLFLLSLILCWRFLWTRYLSELNIKIWRTKGLLNLIPMRIITNNDLLKNQFTSGQLQNAVR